MWGESDYYKSLDAEDKLFYKKKLTLGNGRTLPDPYFIGEDNWDCNVSKLPNVVWPDIYNYLIDKPSIYTKQKLKAYKSLEAYNFFLSGHVQDIYVFTEDGNNYTYLKAEVLKMNCEVLELKESENNMTCIKCMNIF